MIRGISKAAALIGPHRGFTTIATLPRVPIAFSSRCYDFHSFRYFSKDRASKIVKPGEAIVVDGAPHKVQKITQGKRGKGGGYVR
jgi:hypothetical protein